MRKITLLVLLSLMGVSLSFSQAHPGKKQSRNLQKLLHQGQSDLRSTYADGVDSKPDSSVVRDSEGQRTNKIVYTFEEYKETLDIYEFYEGDTTLEREVYYYDENKNDTLYISYDFVNNAFVPDQKTVYKYDDAGILIFQYGYSYEDNQWREFEVLKFETVMNQGTPATIASQTWYRDSDGDGIFEKKTLKYDYTYNASGQELSNAYSTWSDEKNDWIPQSRETSEYDSDGKLKYYYDENWDDDTQTWRPDEEKFVFSYDSKGRIFTIDAYEVSEETHTWDMSAWVFQQTFYYTDETGIPEIHKANISIQANDQSISIESETGLSILNIYNVTGSLLYAKQLSGNVAVVTNPPLNPGTYIIQVRTVDNQSKVVKAILK